MILRELAGVPDERRTARFRCVIAIATPDGHVRSVDGVFEGRIAQEIRGEHGFGYDPIFLLPDRGVTSAELPPDEKNAISHRGQAARKALAILRTMSHGG
jgi:XTP/dITP diphosphohydrolase